MTPEERAAMREWHVKASRGTYAICACGQLWTCPTITLLDDLDAATAEAERWRAQAGKLTAALEDLRAAVWLFVEEEDAASRRECYAQLSEVSEEAEELLDDPDAASALAELRALPEVAAATTQWRALDLRIIHMQMADREQVQTDWTRAELRLTQALAALAVTQGGVRDG